MIDKLREFIRSERISMTEQRDNAVATYHRACGALLALDGLEKFVLATDMTIDELQEAIERGKLNGGQSASPVT